MNPTPSTRLPWIRSLSLLAFLGLFFYSDPILRLFLCFGGFIVWGSDNPLLRAISYVGFLGFLGVIGFFV